MLVDLGDIQQHQILALLDIAAAVHERFLHEAIYLGVNINHFERFQDSPGGR